MWAGGDLQFHAPLITGALATKVTTIKTITPKPKPKAARTDENLSQTHRFTTTELFRYSALTMNGHRIHYDVDYARSIEGYTGWSPTARCWRSVILDR